MHTAAFVLPHYIQQTLSEVDYCDNGDLLDKFDATDGLPHDENECFLSGCVVQ